MDGRNAYSYQDKLKLVEKIERLKKKKYYLEVYKIIAEDQPKLVSNENGIFINFQNLKNTTYQKLENYINSIKVTPTKKPVLNINFDNINNRFDFIDSDKLENSKIRISNKEKNVIKKQKYSDYLENATDSQNMSYRNFKQVNYETNI